MNIIKLQLRMRNFYRRVMSSHFNKNPHVLKNHDPIISITFDDFPRSSYVTGGEVLGNFNYKATYFVSLGLIGKNLPVGTAFIKEDIIELIANGHEIGCHTYDHCDSWMTSEEKFRNSIIANQEALAKITDGSKFNTFSFPKTSPHPRIKAIANSFYTGCRGGGQTFNKRRIDLNLLKSYFIDKKNREKWNEIKEIIDITYDQKAWLILATHDICENPSDFGCTIDLFSKITKYIAKKKIDVLTISDVLNNF